MAGCYRPLAKSQCLLSSGRGRVTHPKSAQGKPVTKVLTDPCKGRSMCVRPPEQRKTRSSRTLEHGLETTLPPRRPKHDRCGRSSGFCLTRICGNGPPPALGRYSSKQSVATKGCPVAIRAGSRGPRVLGLPARDLTTASARSLNGCERDVSEDARPAGCAYLGWKVPLGQRLARRCSGRSDPNSDMSEFYTCSSPCFPAAPAD